MHMSLSAKTQRFVTLLNVTFMTFLAACGGSGDTSSTANSAVSGPFASKLQSWSVASVDAQPNVLSAGEHFLSDLDWVFANNGWGPIEKNSSNGELQAGDGRPLQIGGQVYAKGLGVHSNSEIVYSLDGSCTALTATVGLDDEIDKQSAQGSVIFQVFVDGVQQFDSGIVRGNTPAQSVNVNIAGAKQIKLAVTDAEDNNRYDHANWADAKLNCGVGSTSNNVVFPVDSRVIDVTKAPYFAKGDGVSDDTQALRAALTAGRASNQLPVYLPAGTYLISDTVAFPERGIVLQGQGEGRTIIRLKDNASGFSASANGKAALSMYELEGSTGSWHWNSIFDLTVDVGVGNPGAIGLRLLSNNTGGLRNVRIVSSGPGRAGKTGLDMTKAWVGPVMLRNVTVEGFDTGILAGGSEYSITFEKLTLKYQQQVGLANYAQVINIRGLKSENAVPVIQNRVWAGANNNEMNWGVVTLVDANLRGGSGAQFAIENPKGKYMRGYLYARNVQTSGYQAVISNEGIAVPGTTVDEYTSSAPLSLFPSPAKSLGLPVQDTPEVPWDALADWANVETYGANGQDGADDTKAIQAALDSGKTTVYFPYGKYFVTDTLRVRGKVRRVIGLESGLEFTGNLGGSTRPAFRFEDGSSPIVVLERFSNGGLGQVENASTRALVMRNVQIARYWNSVPGGKVFLEDVVTGPLVFDRQTVWARQVNPEVRGGPEIVNLGSTLWVLGLKTEYEGSVLENRAGAKTELLGGLFYSNEDRPSDQPAFINVDSSLSIVGGESSFNFDGNFKVLVRETRNGETRELLKADAPARMGYGLGFVLPLYSGYLKSP